MITLPASRTASRRRSVLKVITVMIGEVCGKTLGGRTGVWRVIEKFGGGPGRIRARQEQH